MYLKLKVREPQRNSSTATSETKIQVFILAATEEPKTLIKTTNNSRIKRHGKRPSKNQTTKLKLSSTMQGMEMSFTNPTTREVP